MAKYDQGIINQVVKEAIYCKSYLNRSVARRSVQLCGLCTLTYYHGKVLYTKRIISDLRRSRKL